MKENIGYKILTRVRVGIASYSAVLRGKKLARSPY